MKVMQKLKDKQGAVYIRACVILIILSMVFIAVFSFAMAVSLAQAQRKGAFQTLDKYTQKNSIEIYDSIKMHSDETQSLDASAFISSLCLAQGLVQEEDDYVSYDNDGDYRFVLSDFQMSFIVDNTTKIYVRYNLNIPFRFMGTVTWLSVPMVITSTLNPIYETQNDGLAMYTVNHWKEELDGTYVLDRSWTLRGTPTNDKFKPPTIDYPGFTAQSFQGQPLRADRTTVFDIYYNRNIVYVDFIVTGNNRTKVGYTGAEGENLVIPAAFKDGNTWYKVVSIGRNAFFNCKQLASVTIPDTVTSIEDYAFYSCSGLTGVTLGSRVTSIGGYAFQYCSGLTGELVIPDSVTSIDKYAFYGCSGLTGVTLGSGMTSIGAYAFQNCSGLTGELAIPDSVTSIDTGAFYGCSGLTGITIGSGLTSIDDYVFYGCSGLTGELVIPDHVINIGHAAFHGCSGLTGVTTGSNVTSIGSYAFYTCYGLVSATFENPVGWWRATSASATSGIGINTASLENAATAATYLRLNYTTYYWTRE